MTTMPVTPEPARLDQWPDEAADQMARQQMAGGWLRALPTAGVQILGAVSSRGRAVTRDELGGVLPVEPVDGDRWTAPCWYGLGEDEAQAATLNRYAAAYELAPVRSCAELLTLLVTAGVLWEKGGRIGPVSPVPGVDEVFPVDNSERAEIARLRNLAARL